MNELEKESLYQEALELKNQDSYEAKLRAYKRFVELGNYKDSVEYAAECKKVVSAADDFVDNVYGKRKIIKKILKALAVCAALFIIGCVLYNTVIIREIRYKEAVTLFEQGEFEKARSIFESLGKYKNSESYMKDSSQKTEIAVGSTIYFGSIEQDNDGKPEYIEWIILDIQDNKALLISKYAIYNYMYDDNQNDSPWSKSLLHEWLNNDFLTKCFTTDERLKICHTSVVADRNPYYEQNFAEENSWDAIFVLSASEYEKYLDTNEKRMAYATPYAMYYGAVLNAETGTTFYWTRTQGSTSNNVVTVDSTGEIFYAGSVKTSVRRSVRPALWIDLEGFVDKEHNGPNFDNPEITGIENNEDYIN